jgi:hypothetical protein
MSLVLDALCSCEDYHIFIRPKGWTPMLVALTRMSRVGQKAVLTTPIHELERYMRCKDCSEVRGYPYKRSRRVRPLAAQRRPAVSKNSCTERGTFSCSTN